MSGLKHWEKQNKKAYRDWLKRHKPYDLKWILNRIKAEVSILYDETVNSLVPLRIHSKRSGKFNQCVFQVVYDMKRKYGYVKILKIHFNKLRSKDVKQFKEEIERLDPTFKGWWLKDERRFGSKSSVEGMINVGKYISGQIERLFGFKNGIYRRKAEIQTQEELTEIYYEYFNKLKIYPINF